MALVQLHRYLPFNSEANVRQFGLSFLLKANDSGTNGGLCLCGFYHNSVACLDCVNPDRLQGYNLGIGYPDGSFRPLHASICFDPPCYIPSGIISYSEQLRGRCLGCLVFTDILSHRIWYSCSALGFASAFSPDIRSEAELHRILAGFSSLG